MEDDMVFKSVKKFNLSFKFIYWLAILGNCCFGFDNFFRVNFLKCFFLR